MVEGTMGEGGWLVLFLAAQRLAELGFATWNTRRLLANGAVEFGAAHYHLIVALHALWLIALWVGGHDRPVGLAWLAIFIVLQLARLWVIASLGRRWTTRIIVSPGVPLRAAGPYRWVSHPNYAVVCLEIAIIPLALGLPAVAVVFSLANAGLLWLRISAENRALAWGAAQPKVSPQSLANAGSRR
jgi:methyltransferase